jgi:DNA-binding LytR/AlgR family response regulator
MVAENGNDAWDGFLEHEPQVVFLDIRMPGLSGLDVARRIGKLAHVVFVTAYDQYAVDAFDAGAVDYLLKPVQPERLERAVARLRDKLETHAPRPPADMCALLRTPERPRCRACVPNARAGSRPASVARSA